MAPDARAFLLAVIRYQSLRHAPTRPRSPEWTLLNTLLGEPPIGALRPEWEQRGFKRVELDCEAYLRAGDLTGPARLLDLSATGARVRDEAGLALSHGAPLSLILEPSGSILRIELPGEVVRCEAAEIVALRFQAAPLVAHQRIRGIGRFFMDERAADPRERSANDSVAAAA
jgi:hypothetical protein